jgi:hypothetical protein
MKIGYRPKIALMTHDVNNENEEDFCPLPSSYTRLVKRCLLENPFDRPTCKDIQKSLKKMYPLQMSPIDLIFKKMSLYQISLEQAVQLRTYELEQEKHKSENLLYSTNLSKHFFLLKIFSSHRYVTENCCRTIKNWSNCNSRIL